MSLSSSGDSAGTTVLAPVNYEAQRKMIFEATVSGLKCIEKAETILAKLREIVLSELLKRQSDIVLKGQLEKIFDGVAEVLAQKSETDRRDWILKKSEELLNFVLLERERVAVAAAQAAQAVAEASATQEAMARRAADVMAAQTGDLIDKSVRTGADAPRVWYDRDTDTLILPEEEEDKTVRLSSPESPKIEQCDVKNFPEFIKNAILYRTAQILRFFQKTNTELMRDITPLPFVLSSEFAHHLERVISEMVFPAMQMSGLTAWSRSKATEAMFVKRKDWDKIDSDSFWNSIDAADKKELHTRWNKAWSHVTRMEEGKVRGARVASVDRQNLCALLGISDVTDTMRVESDFSRTYTPPTLGPVDLDFFHSLISMDHHQIDRMEVELEKILAIYQQEFNPTMLQQRATDGATREVMMRVIKWEIRDGPFARYLSEFMTIMVYRVCPMLPSSFIRGIVSSYKSSEQMDKVPYVTMFAKERRIA